MSRSLKKGPYVAYHLLEKINKMNSEGKKDTILTWSRSSTIAKYGRSYNSSLQR
jgi:small subunit ribosomal protein S19